MGGVRRPVERCEVKSEGREVWCEEGGKREGVE